MVKSGLTLWLQMSQPSADLIALLYRNQWEVGNVLIWDIRVSLHRGNHKNTLHDRALHRGMDSVVKCR